MNVDQSLCYLATPYTKTASIDRAFAQAARIAGHLSMSGLTIFCPIAHGHTLARAVGLDPKDPSVFARLNEEMLRRSDVLIVVQMEGWLESDGMRDEIAYFERHHKPIFDMDPQTQIMTHRRERDFIESIPDGSALEPGEMSKGFADRARDPWGS